MGANIKAMREALLCILDIAERDMPNYCRSRARDQGETESIRAWSNTIVELAKQALAKPARNCDVGMPEEQEERWFRFCQQNQNPFSTDTCLTCDARAKATECGCKTCGFAWAQMPYKGGDNDGNIQ